MGQEGAASLDVAVCDDEVSGHTRPLAAIPSLVASQDGHDHQQKRWLCVYPSICDLLE
jgi:hypothetical protein